MAREITGTITGITFFEDRLIITLREVGTGTLHKVTVSDPAYMQAILTSRYTGGEDKLFTIEIEEPN